MTIKEMRERRGKLAADMAQMVEKDELKTAEGRTKFDLMDKEQGEIKEQIDRMERAAALEAESRQTTRPPENPVGQPKNPADAEAEQRWAKTFRRWLLAGQSTEMAERLGIAPLTAEERTMVQSRMAPSGNKEQRDMGTGGGATLSFTSDGPLVPVGFVQKIEEALKYYGGMLQASEIMDTATGQPLPYPTDNDTTNSGEIVGEGAQVTTADVSVSQITFGAYKFSTKMVRVSMELMQDSAFDIEAYLAKKFAIRLGRIWNTKFTLGTGTNEPKGIVTAATVGLSSSTTPAIQGDDNAASPDPTTQFGYLDLVNLEHSVDKAYRNGAKWMAHDTTVRYWKTLKDKYGRPLWTPGMVSNAPDTILNYPFIVNNDMAQLATGNKTVLFGALDKYLIRRVKQLSVLRLQERFADYGQVAFLGFARADGNLLDAGTHPVKYGEQQ